MLMIKDAEFNEILVFLDACDYNAKKIKADFDPMNEKVNMVSDEARLLKMMFLKLKDGE